MLRANRRVFLAHKTYRYLKLLNSQKYIKIFCYFKARAKLTFSKLKTADKNCSHDMLKKTFLHE